MAAKIDKWLLFRSDWSSLNITANYRYFIKKLRDDSLDRERARSFISVSAFWASEVDLVE